MALRLIGILSGATLCMSFPRNVLRRCLAAATMHVGAGKGNGFAMSMRSDEELMSDVAEGDLTAFEQLVRRHQDSAWNAAFRLVGDLHAAEDISQEAFLRVLRAAHRYQPTAAFRTYLYRIVTNLCRDYRRKATPSLCQNPDAQADQAPSPEACVVAREEHRAVQEAIASLPDRQREAIVLRYYERLSYEEIAGVTGGSRKAVERLLARGRAALTEILRERLGR
jgi:RNA polymerase sigma-70 factor, ECF subfamily